MRSITFHKKIIFCLTLLWGLLGFCQQPPEVTWIAYPSANNQDYGVFHFRKEVELGPVPKTLNVRISADNRYCFFVNGTPVSYGPAKGDLQTYKYDVVDIAPFLKTGNNILAAQVFNAGKDRQLSFFTVQTAFMLKAEDEAHQFLNSDGSWRVLKNEAYQPVSYYDMLFKDRWFYGFYACGPGDNVDASKYPWGWKNLDFDDSDWETAEELTFQKSPWPLMERNIPFMASYREAPKAIRKVTGFELQSSFLDGKKTIVPANSKTTILMDYGKLTMGYPELTVNNGAKSTIKINYAEALYKEVNIKAHRDSVNNLRMYGVWDMFRPDGPERTFRPLWKRTFRYVQFNIETKEEPLEILKFESEYSGYPYQNMATFSSDNDTLNTIFKMSQRTLEMCSGETYYDTPFYEQLSYGGDNRPISNISIYNTTDDRLLREVLRLYPQSENVDTKLFKSAYPSQFNFDMGSWSLAWAQTLNDYYTFRGDKEFVRQFVDKIEGVLGFYDRHIDENLGILGTIQSQNFMDWSITNGSIPRANDKREIVNSVMLTLFYLHTLDTTVSLFAQLNLTEKVAIWKEKADAIRSAIKKVAWNEELQLFTDYPNKTVLSQHTNVLAILTDCLPLNEQKELMQRILTYENFDEYTSTFFSYYLFKALDKVGMEAAFLDQLGLWKKFIKTGHTTVGETGFASHDRSDCHAWSAHPAYFLLSLTAGLQPNKVGFKSVLVEPHLGTLKNVAAEIPHPKGKITLSYQKKSGKLWASIALPPGVSGIFRYEGQEFTINEGQNIFKRL